MDLQVALPRLIEQQSEMLLSLLGLYYSETERDEVSAQALTNIINAEARALLAYVGMSKEVVARDYTELEEALNNILRREQPCTNVLQ